MGMDVSRRVGQYATASAVLRASMDSRHQSGIDLEILTSLRPYTSLHSTAGSYKSPAPL